jgi:hypothetical protein
MTYGRSRREARDSLTRSPSAGTQSCMHAGAAPRAGVRVRLARMLLAGPHHGQWGGEAGARPAASARPSAAHKGTRTTLTAPTRRSSPFGAMVPSDPRRPAAAAALAGVGRALTRDSPPLPRGRGVRIEPPRGLMREGRADPGGESRRDWPGPHPGRGLSRRCESGVREPARAYPGRCLLVGVRRPEPGTAAYELPPRSARTAQTAGASIAGAGASAHGKTAAAHVRAPASRSIPGQAAPLPPPRGPSPAARRGAPSTRHAGRAPHAAATAATTTTSLCPVLRAVMPFNF